VTDFVIVAVKVMVKQSDVAFVCVQLLLDSEGIPGVSVGLTVVMDVSGGVEFSGGAVP
jgi:hypothetical protein